MSRNQNPSLPIALYSKLDSFIVTAHSAGISPPAFDELRRRPGREIIRFVKGEWPVGLLDHNVKEKFRQKWGELLRY